eukprot:scaffold3277_cov202-Skeletonema_marinoi.AAC.2
MRRKEGTGKKKALTRPPFIAPIGTPLKTTPTSKDLYQLGVLEREELTDHRRAQPIMTMSIFGLAILKNENEQLSMHISRDSIQPLVGVGEPGRTWSPT